MGTLPSPQPHHLLTHDDLDLLRYLANDFLVLTRQQINVLFPDRALRTMNYRLHKLLSGCFISRRLYPSIPIGPRVPLYYLGPKAAEALGLESTDRGILRRRKHALQIRDGAIPHFLLVSSVRMKFVTATKIYPDYELLSWIPQYDAFWRTLNDHGFPLRPDGYGEARKDSTTMRFFLEVDRGTERGPTIRTKLDEYQRYLTTDRFEQHFSAPSFRVLFLTSSQRRLRHLLRHASAFPGDLFWFSSAETFLAASLFDSIWRIADSDVLQTLSTPL